MTDHTFPSDFLWGVAGSGHQTEGGNADSDTWFAEHVSPTVFKEYCEHNIRHPARNSNQRREPCHHLYRRQLR